MQSVESHALVLYLHLQRKARPIDKTSYSSSDVIGAPRRNAPSITELSAQLQRRHVTPQSSMRGAISPVAAVTVPELRTAGLNDAHRNKEFCDNSISTGKFSLLSFVPLSLFEQ